MQAKLNSAFKKRLEIGLREVHYNLRNSALILTRITPINSSHNHIVIGTVLVKIKIFEFEANQILFFKDEFQFWGPAALRPMNMVTF